MHVHHNLMTNMICIHCTRTSILLTSEGRCYPPICNQESSGSLSLSNQSVFSSFRFKKTKNSHCLSIQITTCGDNMSRNDISFKQQSEQEVAVGLPVEGTERRATSTHIRALHVLILGGLGALGPLANDMYVPSLPALSHDLVATTSQVQMTLSAFILGLALGQIIAGPISDALGRRRPLL